MYPEMTTLKENKNVVHARENTIRISHFAWKIDMTNRERKNRLILYRKLNKTQGDWLTTAKLCMYEWMYVCMDVRMSVRDGQSGK